MGRHTVQRRYPLLAIPPVTALQLALAVAVVAGGSTHLFVVGFASLNGIRDRILTGRTNEGVPLTLEHRRLLYRADWRPLRTGLGALSVVSFGLLLVLPELTVDPGGLRLVCYGLAAATLAAFVVGGGLRRQDRRLLERALESAGRRGMPPKSDPKGSARGAPAPGRERSGTDG